MQRQLNVGSLYLIAPKITNLDTKSTTHSFRLFSFISVIIMLLYFSVETVHLQIGLSCIFSARIESGTSSPRDQGPKIVI